MRITREYEGDPYADKFLRVPFNDIVGLWDIGSISQILKTNCVVDLWVILGRLYNYTQILRDKLTNISLTITT